MARAPLAGQSVGREAVGEEPVAGDTEDTAGGRLAAQLALCRHAGQSAHTRAALAGRPVAASEQPLVVVRARSPRTLWLYPLQLTAPYLHRLTGRVLLDDNYLLASTYDKSVRVFGTPLLDARWTRTLIFILTPSSQTCGRAPVKRP